MRIAFRLSSLAIIFASWLIPKSSIAQTLPNQISGLSLWLRADSLVTKDVNDFVSSWSNSTGTGASFSQSTSAAQPRWVDNVWNGKPVIRFDGSNDFLNGGNNYQMGMNNRTSFIVCKANTISGYTFYSQAATCGGSFRYSFTHSSGSGLFIYYNDGPDIFLNTSQSPLNSNIWSNVINRSALQMKLYKNSAQIPQVLSLNSTAPFVNICNFVIGSYDPGQSFLNGDIAEFIIYDRALSDAERNQIELYLARKYAQQINLGPDIKQTTGSMCSITLDAGAGFPSYTWSTGAGTQTIAVNQPGIYWVSSTDAFGYTTSDTIKVSFITVPDTILCPDSTLAVGTGLTGSYTYTWSTGVNTPIISINSAGTYRVTVSDGTCSRSDTFTVTLNSFPSLVSLGPDTTLCLGNAIGLQSGSQLVSSYLWAPGGATTPSISISGSGTVNYSVTVTDSLGCKADDNILVTIAGAAPSANFRADTVCQGVATSFINMSTPALIDSFLWNFGGSNTSTLENPTFTFNSPGIHNVTLTVTSGTICKNSITKPVFVRAGPSVSFNVQQDACVANPYFFSGNVIIDTGDAVTGYNWSFGDGSPNSNQLNTFHTYSSTGNRTVTFTVTTQNGCTGVYTGTLSVVSSAPIPGQCTLNYPPQGFIGGNYPLRFSWNAATGAASYTLQIARDNIFSILPYVIPGITGLDTTLFISSGNYYWRVLSVNACGDNVASAVRQFSIIDINSVNCLNLWLRADGRVDKSANDTVSSWRNEILASTVKFDSASSASQPKWVNNVLNGRPVIRFNGAEDFLSAGDVLDVRQNSRTVFTVSTTNTTTYTLYAKADGPGKRLGFVAAGSLYVFFDAGNSVQYTHPTAPTGSNIFTYKADRSQQILRFYRNSGLLGSATPVSTNDLDVDERFLLGAYNQGATNQIFYLNGDLAEMIMADCVLPDSVQNQIEQYLRFKYAPQINLGPDITVSSGVCPISLNIGSGFTSIQWSNGATTPSVSLSTGGTYWVTAKDIFGYTTADTIVITLPYQGINAGNATICLDDSIPLIQQISPTTGLTFQWYLNNNLIAGAVSDTFHASVPGNYYSVISDGSCSIYSDTIAIGVDTFKLMSLLPSDTTICGGNDIAVSAPQATSYLWSTGLPDTTSGLVITSTGDYSVTVTNSNSCVATDSIHVIIKGVAPLTDFEIRDICNGDVITFTNNTVPNLPDSIHFWQWNYGDGNTDTFQAAVSPSHVFPSIGSYPVTLFIVTDSGCTGIKTKTLGVYPYPSADFSYTPPAICAQTNVSFLGNSQIAFPDSISTWTWVFDNTDSFFTKNVSRIFIDTGTANVTFKVTSNHGCSDSLTRSVYIYPALNADFEFSNICFGGFTLFADSSTGDSIISYFWDFDDGSFPYTLPNPPHQFPAADSFNVRLIIRNATGCADTAVKQVVIVSNPVASFVSPNICLGFDYAPADSSISLSEPIAMRRWFIGDSVFTTSSPHYLFFNTGTYPVKLVVSTGSGCSDSVVKNVTVSPNPSVVFSFAPLYGEAPLDVTFDNFSTNASAFQWDFGDGSNFSTAFAPMHTYLLNDTFNITLTASSDSGCMNSSIRRLVVAPTELDIAVDNVDAEIINQQGGSALVKVSARISNVGTRLITSAKLYAMLGGGGVIAEDLTDTLNPGDVTVYVFDAQFVLAYGNTETYVCVEARSTNNGEAEKRYDNNAGCTSLDGNIQLMGPFPNPVNDKSVLGVILPKTGRVKISIADALGQYVYKETEFVLPAGRSDFEIPAQQLSAAEYFIRVIYNDEKYVRKFIIKR